MRKRTLANFSHFPIDHIETLRRALRGERLEPVNELFDISSSHHHGHVQAVRTALKQLGFEELISSRGSQERDLVVALVTARLLKPDSKLATTRWRRIHVEHRRDPSDLAAGGTV